jgi:hypothetical protein
MGFEAADAEAGDPSAGVVYLDRVPRLQFAQAREGSGPFV